ncbi:MAG: extracellular solute-binding protein [Candidatus Cloacimonetes bacterium]|nr:extracellular solute-binding protein [Candidatus Cloacimonadota bacterium]
MKKLTALVLSLVLLFAVCTSAFAAGAKEAAPADGAKQKIVWTAYGYLSESKADRIKADFEAAYPQYEVEYIDLGSDDYLVRFDTMIASGERVDMALAMDQVEYNQRAKQGMFLPIESYVTKDGFDLQDAFGPGIKNAYVDGELYGLPYTKGGFYVFYNKDMFDAAGIAYPTDDWTWDDFEAIAKKLTTGTGASKVYGANVHMSWGYDIDTLPAQMLGWTPFKDANTANMDDPRLKSALELWNRMQNVDQTIISLATFQAEQIGGRMPFSKGQAAMLLSNWWSATWFLNNKFGSTDGDKLLNFNIGVVNIPRGDKNTPNNLNSTDLDYYFAVPNTAKNPEGGALLSRFMICEEWSKFGTLSSYRHQDVDEFMQKFVYYVDKDGAKHSLGYDEEFVTKVMGGWTQPISTYYGIDSMINPEGLAVIKDIFDQERELYYFGEQTIDQTIKAMQTRSQAELDALK